MSGKPYTVAEVAELMGYSPQTVTRLFERERGIQILVRPEKMLKRRYRAMTTPRECATSGFAIDYPFASRLCAGRVRMV